MVRPLGRELRLRHLAGAESGWWPSASRRATRPWSPAPTGCLSYQQSCGGWGESPDSYDDPTVRGQGPATASQTAWAMLGLLAAGLDDHPAVARGARCLVEQQKPDGTWDEPEFTGTGFPRVFYLRYHYYPIYFPLLALSRLRCPAGSDARRAEELAFPRRTTAARGRGVNDKRGSRRPSRCDFRSRSPADDQLPAARSAWPGTEVPAGADARAAARVQSHLHRLRADSRVRRARSRTSSRSTSAWPRSTSAVHRSSASAAASR